MSVAVDTTTNLINTDGKASKVAESGNASVDRVHYLDNLRALAMMLGVLLHAGLAYANPAQAIWIATDTTSSTSVDVGIWFIHLFRMGLFFCFLVTSPNW